MIKRKQWAATASVFAILPLGIIGFNAVRVLQNPGYTQASAHPSARPVEIPSAGVVREIAQLTGDMATLGAGSTSQRTQVDLTLFGYSPATQGNQRDVLHESPGDEDPGRPETEYVVSLAFSSETKGFCVMDGKFYPEGGILPDGARIVKVEPQRVLIHKFNLERWIPVTDPVGVKWSPSQ